MRKLFPTLHRIFGKVPKIRYIQLEERLGYRFQDISMLELALTHKSVAAEQRQGSNPAGHNERLEFLGDAVLELIVSSYLYEAFPEYTEGELSKLRAVLVSRPILAMLAQELRLGEHMIFGVGEAAAGGCERESNLANAVEAVIAGIYLDGGMRPAQRFVLKILTDKIQQLAQDDIKYDYKSALQERWQKNDGQTPIYSVVAESDIAHEKIFEVEVNLSGMSYGQGIGRSKKRAEQQAAKVALGKLDNRTGENHQG